MDANQPIRSLIQHKTIERFIIIKTITIIMIHVQLKITMGFSWAKSKLKGVPASYNVDLLSNFHKELSVLY